MNNFNNMMKQAQELQNKMSEAQKKVEQLEAEGSSGGGLIKIIIDGAQSFGSTHNNKKDSRAGLTGTSVSPGKEYRVNDNGELEYFQPLVPGNIFSSTQVERKLRADNGALNMTFLPEIVTDLRSNKGPIPQPKPGDSTLSEETELLSTHGINHFIPEFNIITDLGEKV